MSACIFCIGANRKKKDFQTSCLNDAVVECEWAGDEDEFYRLRSVQRNTQGKCSERKSKRFGCSLFRKVWLRYHHPVHHHIHHSSIKQWRVRVFFNHFWGSWKGGGVKVDFHLILLILMYVPIVIVINLSMSLNFYSLSSNGGSSIVSIPRKQCFVFREEISPILQVSLPSAVVHKAL